MNITAALWLPLFRTMFDATCHSGANGRALAPARTATANLARVLHPRFGAAGRPLRDGVADDPRQRGDPLPQRVRNKILNHEMARWIGERFRRP